MKNRCEALLLFLSTMLFAVTSFAAVQSGAKEIDGIAAIVNDDVITKLELDRAMAREKNKKGTIVGTDDRRGVLDRMVDDMLFEQLVSKAKIEVSDDDLARAIAGVLHENRVTLEQLKSELASKGTSYEDYKKDMEKQIKRIKYVNQVIGPQVKITDQDLRDYYQRNQERFRGTHKAHIAEIALPLDDIQTQEQFEELRDLALSIVAKAKRGTSFDSLAMKHSKGPNAIGGGDLGLIDLKELPPIVADTVRRMTIGDISNPIFTGNSLIIVKLISLPEISAGDFEKLRDNIYSALYDERIEETLTSYLLKERQKAFIEIRQYE